MGADLYHDRVERERWQSRQDLVQKLEERVRLCEEENTRLREELNKLQPQG